MAEVTVTVNDQEYSMACADGEEDHLREMAALVDREVNDLSGSLGQMGETRLLLMSALVLADRLDELTRGEAESKRKLFLSEETSRKTEASAAGAINAVAERIENLAAGLKSP